MRLKSVARLMVLSTTFIGKLRDGPKRHSRSLG